LGLGDDTYVTFASGGAFTEFSHEFQTICETGEDVIYLHKGKNIAVNEEVMDDANLQKLGIKRDELVQLKSAEVGNIFNFGTDKCEQMGLFYDDEQGKRTPVFLGSYGVGVSRVMGVLVEKFADNNGLVWPKEVAPYQLHIASLGSDEAVIADAEMLYESCNTAGIDVLWDDRDVSAGEKFADADLMGMPKRVVVSKKTIEGGVYEIKDRQTGEVSSLSLDDLVKALKN
jgi:prolyl-tRNA synthetase